MTRKLTLDFTKLDIEDYLHASIPVRFQNTSPGGFEDLIAHFFRVRGYNLKSTDYSQDFGVDMILDQDGIKTAVKVLRYSATHKVGKNDLLPLIKARNYYRCKHAMVITTSSFDDPARTLGLDEKIILWDWHFLLRALTDTFLEGIHYEDYFEKYPASVTVKDSLKLEIESVDFSKSRLTSEGKAFVKAHLTNMGEHDISIKCELPSLVKKDRSQFRSSGWQEDTFNEGILYAGSTVEIVFSFPKKHIAKFDTRDRIVVSIRQDNNEDIINLEQKLSNVKQECFLVTFCFDRDSTEYAEMIAFRDQILSRSAPGRLLIRAYYAIGRMLIAVFSNIPQTRYVMGPLLLPVIRFLGAFVEIRQDLREGHQS